MDAPVQPFILDAESSVVGLIWFVRRGHGDVLAA